MRTAPYAHAHAPEAHAPYAHATGVDALAVWRVGVHVLAGGFDDVETARGKVQFPAIGRMASMFTTGLTKAGIGGEPALGGGGEPNVCSDAR